MKRFLLLIILLMMLCTGCSRKIDAAGKMYTYENGGFGSGDFKIRIDTDGTFTYYAGSFSSYIGYGQWSVKRDTLTLIDDEEFCGNSRTNHFRISGNTLIFQEYDSDNFHYIDVQDGEKFHGFPLDLMLNTDVF